MSKRVLFFSSTKSKKMFSIQKFYRTDILLLKDLGYKVKLSNSMLDFFAFWEYDIAFIYFYTRGFFPALIAKMFNKRTLFTGGIDNLAKDEVRKKDYIIQKVFFRLCNIVSDVNILVSNSEIKNIKNFYPKLNIAKSPISYHVIDFDAYRYNPIIKKEKLIITIAWMIREENVLRKGVDKCVHVFHELYKLDPEYKMIIIGSIGLGTELIENLIESYNLKGPILLTGALSEAEKINLLKKSMFYLQLSSYEGFGIAAIEAMASGNVVIHSNKGGLSDTIGERGVIVKSLDDHQGIAKTILRIGQLPNRDNFIGPGIAFIELNFKYEKRLKDLKQIFDSLDIQ